MSTSENAGPAIENVYYDQSRSTAREINVSDWLCVREMLTRWRTDADSIGLPAIEEVLQDMNHRHPRELPKTIKEK